MKAMNAIKARLKGKKGESIAETLVALLISSLGLVLLAGMIAASVRLIDRSKKTAQSYTDAENLLIAQGASSVSGTVTIQDSAGNGIKMSDENTSGQVGVVYYVNDETGGAVVSYKVG